MRKTGLTVLVLILLTAGFIILSPYRYYSERGGLAIVQSVEVQASAERLYAYLGNSANAAEWSSYVSLIEPLNEDVIADGDRGSRRRCFKKGDESVTWDELIEVTEPPAYRRLSIYNLQNFSVESQALLAEQIYEPIDSSTSRLSLTLYIDSSKSSFLDHAKMYVASFTISSIFRANLEKIKSINES